MKKQKNMSGITLIALIVTIVVLLILAGVTIVQITGSDSVMEKAREAKEKNDQASYDEQFALQSVIDEFGNWEENTDNFNSDKGVNSPKITKGMIPVKWNGSNWVVCSTSDLDWYTYGNTDETKLWANIMLSDGAYKAGVVQAGTVVAEEELGSMYVWIPRYAYLMPTNSFVYGTTSNPEPHTIDVTFLMGNTNKDSSGTYYEKASLTTNTETTKVVHPGFTIGNKELTGIWVAKFEASGTTESGAAVGNASADGKSTTNHPNGEYDPVAADGTTIVRSIPNVPSWRGIRIGDCEWQSMSIAGVNKDKYGIDYCNSHLLKNSEWGAVAYLCYSNYGNVPMKNACGSLTQNKDSNWYYNLYTGQGPASNTSDSGTYPYSTTSIADHGYTTTNGQKASTTGNVTGIYDMNGGAWEYVAAYLDNKSGNLGYGNSTISGADRYFSTQYELNSGYSELWDRYEVSQEERNDQIDVGATNAISKSALWSGSTDADSPYTAARYRLTKYIYDNLPKGIGVNEISNTFSFYNVGKGWYGKTGTNSETGEDIYGAKTTTAWDSDYVLLGHASYPFVGRGGAYGYGTSAGVFASNIGNGNGDHNFSFRPALVL